MYAAFHITAQHSHYVPIEDFGTVVPSAMQHGHYIMFLCFHSSVADSKMPSRTEFISGRMHVFPLLHVPAKQLSLKLIGIRTDSFLTLL